MEGNKLWLLLNGEVTKTTEAIDELMNDLIEEYQLVTLEEKKEELLLQKYWLLILQERLKKIVDRARHAGIKFHTELKQNIRSAIDNDNFEEFNYSNIHAQTEF